MNHDELKEKIFELYDGECAPAELSIVKAHLASCNECQSLLTK
jgi:anti-sigma factor RsiW